MTITLELAGGRVRVDCEPAALAVALAGRFEAFVTTDPRPPDLALQVMLVASPSEGAVSSASLAHAAPHFFGGTGEECMLDTPSCSGSIDLRNSRATLTGTDALPLADLEYFVRTIYALVVIREGGLLMHAAGLCTDDLAYLFIGQSGSGKSTVVALSPGAEPLNDDLIVVRPENGRWMAYATPFWNLQVNRKAGSRISAPIAGIYKLVQDQNVYLESPSLACAVAELVANCPVVNSEPAWLPMLLTRCRRLARDVPVQLLHFRKEPSFWDLIRCAAKKELGA
jgi:hypothetical protein